ncbi:MAG: ABC transporter permease subunit [Planctomycetota bacterium]|nr:ABC transporter permease subunit [Planctomycetota bacterium]
MRAFAKAALLIAHVHFVRSLTGKRLVFCVLLAHLPALAGFVASGISSRVGPANLAANLGWMMLLQIAIPLVALIGGSAVVAEEIEDRTITYLFTRPVPRPALLIGRFVATAFLLAVVAASAVFFLLLACERARGKGGTFDAHFAATLYEAAVLGVVAYSALFAALGAFFKHPMILGVAYACAIEGFLANLPGKNQSLTIQYYLRSLIADEAAPAWRKVEGFGSAAFASVERAHIVLAAIVVVALCLGAWRLARRQFELTS